jgi:hypothetical protein
MKRFKISKWGLLAVGLLITIVLFLLGHHNESGAVLANAGAVATLTDQEKKDFSESEQKVILAVKNMVNTMGTDFKKGLVSSEEVKRMIR